MSTEDCVHIVYSIPVFGYLVEVYSEADDWAGYAWRVVKEEGVIHETGACMYGFPEAALRDGLICATQGDLP
ncbi:MAG: hypothetical protein LBI59_11470 [Candidatus Accumulibacter sp.]|jgi:hypothetical protein|nr:hypothetical protein [Accumulibacter sp.]